LGTTSPEEKLCRFQAQNLGYEFSYGKNFVMYSNKVLGTTFPEKKKTLAFLAALHKVHPAYRMGNAVRAGVFNKVPTLCDQLLPHLLADILQTLHS
jgi:hypothetical protein